jgi:hypothetical protein
MLAHVLDMCCQCAGELWYGTASKEVLIRAMIGGKNPLWTNSMGPTRRHVG